MPSEGFLTVSLASGLPYQSLPVPRIESFRPPAGAALDVESASGRTAPLSEPWPELMPDAFLLPAAVEAAQAAADEGPGPWPPVVADDPVQPPLAPPIDATSVAPGTAPRHRLLQALKRLLHQVRAVAEYSAK